MANPQYPLSPITAVFLCYEGLAETLFANSVRPPLSFGQVPVTTETGAQRRAPYCALYDDGRTRDVQSDNGGPEAGEFLFSVFDFDLFDLALAVLAIRFGGRPPADRAGLDGGILQLDSPFSPVNITLVSEQVIYGGQGVKLTGGTLPGGQPETTLAILHQADLTFRVVYSVNANG